MVEACTTTAVAPVGAMTRVAWLLVGAMMLVVVTNVAEAIPENKITDLNGDEGVIDQLETFLLSKEKQQQQLQRQSQQLADQHQKQEQPLKQQLDTLFSPNIPPLGDMKGSERSDGELKSGTAKPDKIEFAVGPSDSRYFDRPLGSSPGADDRVPDISVVRPNTLQTRSGYNVHAPYGMYNSYDGYPGGVLEDDRGRALYPLGARNPAFARNDDVFEEQEGYGGRNRLLQEEEVRHNARGLAAGGGRPVFAPAAEAAGGVYNSDGGYDTEGGYSAAFYNELARRLASRQYGDQEETKVFLRRLEGALRMGDVDTARRMVGGVVGEEGSRVQLEGPLKATSQPESVHYLHHKSQIQRGLDQPQPEPATPPPQDSYNPNDPSSNINIDTNLLKNGTAYQTAAGGVLLAAPPQHLGQSLHSAALSQSAVVGSPVQQDDFSDLYFTALVAGCTAAAVGAIIGTGVCWFKLNKNQRAAKDAEYPAYGVTGPSSNLSPGVGSTGDRTLAHSAHMYHYQQQKNQMIALDKSGVGESGGAGGAASDADSEEEDGEDRDYTVYECPGLAPMGEMVVPNPMYPPEEGTPASPTPKEELDHVKDRN